MSTTSQIPYGDVILLGDRFNVGVTSAVNIFPQDLTPVASPLAWFCIYAVFQAVGRLKIMRTVQGFTTSELLNEDADLKANAAYMFIFPVSSGESINFQFNTSTTISKITVVELQREN